MVKLAPSVIAADFGRLAEQMCAVEHAGADVVHFDAMDGCFVPNLSIGPMVLEAVRRATRLRIDAHLMIEAPERYIDAFAKAGADTIVVHVEATPHLHRAIEQIKHLGKLAGVAVNPGTPAFQLEAILGSVDQVLVMTVNPGFGGQRFIRPMLHKIEAVRRMIGSQAIELCVDGGVDAATARDAVSAGADVLVAGTAVFSHPNGVAAAIAQLRESASKH
ncbi:MAG: ribulose-phosphate 3-epimerase [Chloroflexi bacterium]|nr:ribulose-phosphate 3-epimerase [Chloroflexota bacterium]